MVSHFSNVQRNMYFSPQPITNDVASHYNHVGILRNIVIIPLALRVQPNWESFNPKLPAKYLWCCQMWIHHPNRNVHNAPWGRVGWGTPGCLKFLIIDISANIWRAIYQSDCCHVIAQLNLPMECCHHLGFEGSFDQPNWLKVKGNISFKWLHEIMWLPCFSDKFNLPYTTLVILLYIFHNGVKSLVYNSEYHKDQGSRKQYRDYACQKFEVTHCNIGALEIMINVYNPWAFLILYTQNNYVISIF